MYKYILILFLLFFSLESCISYVNDPLNKNVQKNSDKDKIQDNNQRIFFEKENTENIKIEDKIEIEDKEADIHEGVSTEAAFVPLSEKNSLEKIKELIHPPERPILIDNKEILSIFHDFNADKKDEVCVLGIESEEPDWAQIDFISDFSLPYKEKRKDFRFFLYFFNFLDGKYSLLNKIGLGKYPVYESLFKFNLREGYSDPAVISINFLTGEGPLRKWLIFKQPGFYPITSIDLRETISIKTLVEDIDDDGILDITVYERSMEEGIGYETFITWKKWNGKNFSDIKTINIVRNLNEFLSRINELCLVSNTKDLLSFVMTPEELRDYQIKRISDQTILIQLLGLSDFFQAGYTKSDILKGIQEIIFPKILDNPFSLRDEQGSFFKLSYKIVYDNGISLIPEILIYMLKNPFGKNQFVLSCIKPESE